MSDSHGMLKISIDVAACMGHGRCYTLADELFDSDAAGRSVILLAEVPAELRRQALLAAASCPEHAIRVTACRATTASGSDGA